MNVNNHVAIIAGSTGTLGPQISEKLKDEGYKVYGGSRSAKTDFQYTNEQLKDTAYWYGKIAELANESSTIVLINTIGQASPPAGSTLEDVNIRPVVALAMAGKQFATDHPEKKLLSSKFQRLRLFI